MLLIYAFKENSQECVTTIDYTGCTTDAILSNNVSQTAAVEDLQPRNTDKKQSCKDWLLLEKFSKKTCFVFVKNIFNKMHV